MKMNDPSYLLTQQYANPNNLNARIAIHSLFSTGKQDWAGFIFQYLGVKEDMKVLGLGCGNATQWQENRDRYPKRAKIILTDMSSGMLIPANTALAGNLRYQFACCDIQDIPFKNARFDRVTANHMLYHVPDIQKGLAEVVRVLKPEGVFMAATNGENHMTALYDLVHAFEPAYQMEDYKHTRFSLENGRNILQEFFADTRLVPYKSDLWVTNAEMLSDYVLSMWDAADVLSNECKSALSAYFQKMIDRDGGIFIAKSTGIFLASNDQKYWI